MTREKHLKALAESLGISYKTLLAADIKCYINEFLSDVTVGNISLIDENMSYFKYSFKKPIYIRKTVYNVTGGVIKKNNVVEDIVFMTYNNKSSHIVFEDERLNMKHLIMKEYGLKHKEIDELLRLPIKRFFKSINHPQIKIGHKKIKFIN